MLIKESLQQQKLQSCAYLIGCGDFTFLEMYCKARREVGRFQQVFMNKLHQHEDCYASNFLHSYLQFLKLPLLCIV